MKSKVVAIIMALIGAVLFSAKAVFARYEYQISDIDYSNLLVLRMGFALPFYSWVLLRELKKGPIALSQKEWVYLFMLGFLGYYLASVLDFLGLQYIDAALERVILFIYPTFVLILNYLIYRKPIKLYQIGAIVITYIGIIVTFSGRIQTNEQENILTGGFLIVLCALAYAFYLVGSDKLIPKVGVRAFTSIALITSGILIFAHNLLLSELRILSYTKEVYIVAFLMAIFSTVIPSFLISGAIKRIGANTTSILASSGPISTIIMGSLILGEKVDNFQIYGTLIVIIGIIIISIKKNKSDEKN